MADTRFYTTGTTYTCPSCQRALQWQKRKDADSLILVHCPGDCPNAGMKFYAPGQTLTEFTEDAS